MPSVIRVSSRNTERRLQDLFGLQQTLESEIPEGWSDPYSCPLAAEGVCECPKDPANMANCFGNNEDFGYANCEILKMDYELLGGSASALSFGPITGIELEDDDTRYKESQHRRLIDESIEELLDDEKIKSEDLFKLSSLYDTDRRLKQLKKLRRMQNNPNNPK
jgi:hypothetical protein